MVALCSLHNEVCGLIEVREKFDSKKGWAIPKKGMM